LFFSLQELNEFLQDLTAWEHTVKEKEKKLVGSASKVRISSPHPNDQY